MDTNATNDGATVDPQRKMALELAHREVAEGMGYLDRAFDRLRGQGLDPVREDIARARRQLAEAASGIYRESGQC